LELRYSSGVMTRLDSGGTAERFFSPAPGDPWCYSPAPCSGVPSADRPAHSPGGCNPTGKRCRFSYSILFNPSGIGDLLLEPPPAVRRQSHQPETQQHDRAGHPIGWKIVVEKVHDLTRSHEVLITGDKAGSSVPAVHDCVVYNGYARGCVKTRERRKGWVINPIRNAEEKTDRENNNS